MKTTRKVATLAATIITIGSLVGEANAALTLNFDDTSGNTVVTLTAINLNLAGLTSVSSTSNSTTFISPSIGYVGFSGSTDTSISFETAYEIPTFAFGTGNGNTAASSIGASNPFIKLEGANGLLIVDNQNPLPSSFTATATYSGSFTDNGIDDMAQTITFSNSETLSISFITVPEPSSALLLGLGALGFISRRSRSN